jgi:hypothetical protein
MLSEGSNGVVEVKEGNWFDKTERIKPLIKQDSVNSDSGKQELNLTVV